MGLIKDNKELDSTLAAVFVFIAFLVVLGAVLTAIFKRLPIEGDLLTIFQAIKELVQLVLVYHFTKSVPPALSKLGNGGEEKDR